MRSSAHINRLIVRGPGLVLGAIFAGLVLLGLFGPATTATAQAANAQSDPAIPGDPTNNGTKWVILGVTGAALILMGVGALVWKQKLDAKTTTAAEPPPDPFAAVSAPPEGAPLGQLTEPTQAEPNWALTNAPTSPPTTDGPVLPVSTSPTSTARATQQLRTPPEAPEPTTPPTASYRSPSPEDATAEPVWDPAQGTYVQWDPEGEQWLDFNRATQAWSVRR